MKRNRKKGKARMGRPPKAPEDRRSINASVRVTRAEYERLLAEAERQGVTLSGLLMRPWRREGKR